MSSAQKSAESGIVQPGIEVQLLTKHATELDKENGDDPEHVCCSCVYQRKKCDTSQAL